MEALLAGPVAAVLSAAAVGPANHLCCAFSGGVDSVVTLDLLTALQPRFGYRLSAVHIHHGLSPHADAWLAFCAAFCADRGLPFTGARVEVPRDDPDGLEAAARRLRHAVLAAQACDWLVFGHHQDDQAETVLFRLLRGAGVRGAAAMAAVTPGVAGAPGKLRPLLGVRRAEILAYAQERRLAWVEDESNEDCRYTRNALRHRVLPVIEAEFPAAVPALARAAGHFGEAGELLDELAAIDERDCGGVPMARERLLALSVGRGANLLRWQARRMGAAAPSTVRLREAWRQLQHAAPPVRVVLGELACCAYRDRIWLELDGGALPAAQSWHGEATLAWGAGELSFEKDDGEGVAQARMANAAAVRLVTPSPGLRLRLDSRRPSRSFKNLCQEAGIPPWMRSRLPVLEIDGVPAWVGGIGVAAEYRCAPGEAGLRLVWRPAV